MKSEIYDLLLILVACIALPIGLEFRQWLAKENEIKEEELRGMKAMHLDRWPASYKPEKPSK